MAAHHRAAVVLVVSMFSGLTLSFSAKRGQRWKRAMLITEWWVV
jgi:hypothetical protein